MDVLIQCWVHRLIYALQGTPTASIDLVAPLPESKSLLSNNYVVYPGANPNPEEITLHFSNAVVNQIVLKLLRLVMIVVSVALSWRVLEMIKGIRLSLFIVTQEDLRPAFEVGDLVVISDSTNVRIGDMVLFQHTRQHQNSELLLRRLVYRQQHDEKETRIVTKADFNRIDDRFLYKRGAPWETGDKLKGKVELRIPYVGTLLPIRMLKLLSFQRICIGVFTVSMLLSYRTV